MWSLSTTQGLVSEFNTADITLLFTHFHVHGLVVVGLKIIYQHTFIVYTDVLYSAQQSIRVEQLDLFTNQSPVPLLEVSLQND